MGVSLFIVKEKKASKQKDTEKIEEEVRDLIVIRNFHYDWIRMTCP